MSDNISKGNQDCPSKTSPGALIGLGLLNVHKHLGDTQSKQQSSADAGTLLQSVPLKDSRYSLMSANQEPPFAGYASLGNSVDAYDSPLTELETDTSQSHTNPLTQVAPTAHSTPSPIYQSSASIAPELLTEAQVLEKTVPLPYYARDFPKTDGGHRKHARTPQSVETWDSFINNVNATSWDDEPLYPSPTFLDKLKIFNESSVRGALFANVFHCLELLLPENVVFSPHSHFQGTIGEPDAILTDTTKLYLAVEVKTKGVLYMDNLVETFNENIRERQAGITSPVCAFNALRQIFGYLSYNRLRLGVLTCYEKTWFMYRPPSDPSKLCISPIIRCNQSYPTLLQCYFYVIKLACNESFCHSAPPIPQLPQRISTDDSQSPDDDSNNDDCVDDDDDDSNNNHDFDGADGDNNCYGDSSHEDALDSALGKRKRSTTSQDTLGNRRAEKIHHKIAHSSDQSSKEKQVPLDSNSHVYDPSSFDIQGTLGYGRSGTVFEALLLGEKVALKICDLWQHPTYEAEMLNEIAVYHALEDLQGKCIPTLKGSGYTDGGMFAIATEIVGKPIEPQSLNNKERKEIRRALASIHRCGYVHNDIRERNILIRRDGKGFDIRFVDFALSEKGSQEDFRKERALLKQVVGQL